MVLVWAVVVCCGIGTGLAILLIIADAMFANYGECEIDINGGEKKLTVRGGESLLSSLVENKVFIPSACGGRGTCWYCKVQVFSGGGPMLPTETPAFTKRQRRDHWRLACQVKVKENITVGIPEEYLAIQEFEAECIAEKYLTHDMKEISFRLIEPEKIKFRAGQYVQFKCPTPDGKDHVYRGYSIAIGESQGGVSSQIDLIVRLVPGGIGSTYLHNLKSGDRAIFNGPYGEFHLSEDPNKELILVGGGCGMAPMRSLIYTMAEKHPERKCTLFFGARAKRDLFYVKEFDELKERYPKFDYVYALSDPLPDDDWDGDVGFIHLFVDKYVKEGVNAQAFLCGPPPMIEATIEVLKSKGLKEDEDTFYDKF